MALFPLGPLPHIQCHNTAMWVAPPGEHLRPHPLYVTGVPRWGEKMAQMKELIKTPERIQLSDEEISKLSEAEFKTLVVE